MLRRTITTNISQSCLIYDFLYTKPKTRQLGRLLARWGCIAVIWSITSCSAIVCDRAMWLGVPTQCSCPVTMTFISRIFTLWPEASGGNEVNSRRSWAFNLFLPLLGPDFCLMPLTSQALCVLPVSNKRSASGWLGNSSLYSAAAKGETQ